MSTLRNEEALFPYLKDFSELNGWSREQFVVGDAPDPSTWREAFVGIPRRRHSHQYSGYPHSVRARHPDGFVLFLTSGNLWGTREFDLLTQTIDGRRFFVFRKKTLEFEWRRYAATKRILHAMSALPLGQWRALAELTGQEAGASESPWISTVEAASQAARKHLRALSVLKVEEVADAVTVGGDASAPRRVA
jgi:hypothetical protein